MHTVGSRLRKQSAYLYLYNSVVENMRLTSGLLWPMPITLDVSQEEIESAQIKPQNRVALLDPRDYEPLAILTVQDVYKPDKSNEAVKVYGADDIAHPAVHYLHNVAKEFYVGGSLEAIQAPAHYDYIANRCMYICMKARQKHHVFSHIIFNSYSQRIARSL